MKTHRHFLIIGVCSILFFAGPALSEDDTPYEKRRVSSFILHLENDSFAGTDRHYTNGFKISWVYGDVIDYDRFHAFPAWSLTRMQKLPFMDRPDAVRNVFLGIGQKIYTPDNIEEDELIVNDRPYAGWTYLSLGLQSKTLRKLDTVELQLGMVGPASLAEKAQKYVHKHFTGDTPNGWDNQLENEPGLALIYEHKYRLFDWNTASGLGADIIPHIGGSIGNVHTYANAGATLRIGWNVPTDFGVSLIRPAGVTQTPADTRDTRMNSGKSLSLAFFGGIDGRLVARNVFLDGNTWKDSHSVDKKHYLGDLYAGVSAIYGRYMLAYTHVYRSKEFDQQDTAQVFGSLTLSAAF